MHGVLCGPNGSCLLQANVLVSSDGTAMLSDFDFSIMSKATPLVFTETSNSRAGSTRWVVSAHHVSHQGFF